MYGATDDIVGELASRLRHERKRRGWTLKDLASRLSVSITTLSALENRQASPDVALLLQLSEALGVTVATLLPPSKTSNFQVTRRAEVDAHPSTPMKVVSRERWTATPYHNRLWPLAGALVGKYIEPFEIEIEPLPDDQLRFISHTHEEFFFVLRGELETLIKSPKGLVRETLGPGDCMYFWSYLPHCIRSTTAEPARSVHTLYSLHEPADSETANGVSGPVIYLMEAARKSAAQQIAEKIVSLRHGRGMSAAEFAGHLGISVRRLAKIERGVRPISLNLLLHTCRTFRKPTDYFLASTSVDGPSHYVTRAAELLGPSVGAAGRKLRRRSPCFVDATFKDLAAGFKNRGLHPYLLTLDGAARDTGRLLRHRGQEFVYVLRGQVNLVTKRGDEPVTETLLPGDSCLIDASAPHKWVQARFSPYDASGAEMIAVLWHPEEAG
jgi:transcriptional regulator with XRE-family HTH domain